MTYLASRLRPMRLRVRILLALVLALPACDGPQSALAPAGHEAERIANLFWWMAGGAAILWVSVVGIAVYAIRVRPERHEAPIAKLLIIGGGAVLPTSVLAVLVTYGLWLMPELRSPPQQAADIDIEISGEQWWWRVRYFPSQAQTFELANEIRLPLGEPVELRLKSRDVIHSFWVPSLAGKLDMIPGRVNRLVLEPTKTGVFRGACAEYCGTSHAFMAFYAVVMEKEDFVEWIEHQQRRAVPPRESLTARGQRIFLENGCGACHAIRGTDADGVVGPDLTHVGSRLSLAAGTLPNETDAFERWIALTKVVKPGVQMPHFGMLPEEEILALAAYLESLE